MKQFRIVPPGLIGRATLVVVCAVLIESLGSFLLYERHEIRTSRTQQATETAEILATASRVLDGIDPSERTAVAALLGSSRGSVNWRPGLTPPVAVVDNSGVDGMKAAMEARAPALRTRAITVQVRDPANMLAARHISAAAQLRDGSWVQVSTDLTNGVWRMVLQQLISTAVLCLGVACCAILLLRSMGGPLQALERAAENVGKGAIVQLPEEGARDLRRVSRAFNAMQHRIADLLSARSFALAAVSHDLRTPLSRIRLRAEMVTEPEAREAIERDVDEMSAMLNALLDYLGGRHESEPKRLTDVAAICLTLVDDASDLGAIASYTGPDQLAANVRPLALKRAVNNLIQNAITYGGRADLSLSETSDGLVLTVGDNGPGIPNDQLERIVEPFNRHRPGRPGNSVAGFGLGLSIVSKIAAVEGGRLRLTNKAEGGLQAELYVPKRPKSELI